MKKENKTFAAILKILYRLTNYAVAACFLFSLVLTAFFILGNYKNFGDAVQRIILQVMSFSVILLDFFSFFAFIETIPVMIVRGFRYYHPLLMFFYIVMMILGTTLLGFSGIVKNLSTGIALGVLNV